MESETNIQQLNVNVRQSASFWEGLERRNNTPFGCIRIELFAPCYSNS